MLSAVVRQAEILHRLNFYLVIIILPQPVRT